MLSLTPVSSSDFASPGTHCSVTKPFPGRNGVQGLREEWGHWCNVDGAGFGLRPTADTGSELADAFVWVKPGGESDGTSDSSAVRYDSFCGMPDAYKPSPEAGTWNQAYFEMLLNNAKPSFA